jgi:hypothetical protein
MICPKFGTDCINLGVGRECLALSDTDFGFKKCPFYKPSKTDYEARYLFEGRSGVWSPVRGFNGRYFISNEGEVINYRKREVRIYYNNGKPYVKLADEFGFVTRYYVATLVGDAFIEGEGMIKHKDNNYLNCRASNLYRIYRKDFYGETN